MIATTMMVAGLLMMAPGPARRSGGSLTATGEHLRDTYAAAVLQPLPEDMRRMTGRIGGPLVVIRGGLNDRSQGR